jgi:hypothetical protein
MSVDMVKALKYDLGDHLAERPIPTTACMDEYAGICEVSYNMLFLVW